MLLDSLKMMVLLADTWVWLDWVLRVRGILGVTMLIRVWSVLLGNLMESYLWVKVGLFLVLTLDRVKVGVSGELLVLL